MLTTEQKYQLTQKFRPIAGPLEGILNETYSKLLEASKESFLTHHPMYSNCYQDAAFLIKELLDCTQVPDTMHDPAQEAIDVVRASEEKVKAVLQGPEVVIHVENKLTPDELAARIKQSVNQILDREHATPTGSQVDHPAHYGGADNPYEVIKVAEAWGFHEDAYLFNLLKYVARAGKKDPALELQDHKKARFYHDRKIALLEAQINV